MLSVRCSCTAPASTQMQLLTAVRCNCCLLSAAIAACCLGAQMKDRPCTRILTPLYLPRQELKVRDEVLSVRRRQGHVGGDDGQRFDGEEMRFEDERMRVASCALCCTLYALFAKFLSLPPSPPPLSHTHLSSLARRTTVALSTGSGDGGSGGGRPLAKRLSCFWWRSATIMMKCEQSV
jgi:hypothetical protein